MRTLLIVVLAAAALWSGYWVFGARGVENGLRDWLDARASDGWVANYADVQTRGFPNRFDSTITDLELADPATGVAWAAPFFQLFRLSYEPNHVIAIWPTRQSIASPHQRVTLASEDARASLVFLSGTELELDRLSLVAKSIRLESTDDWTADITEVRFATRPSETTGKTDLAVAATGLRPANAALAQLADLGVAPGIIDSLRVDAKLGFDAPWDRTAIESRRPAITDIELDLLQANWGHLELWAAGDLTIDTAGLASGSITIKAKNWREMLQIAVASGWVPEGLAGTLESGLGLLAGLSGSAKTLDAPLTFSRGQVSFGPIPLGSLPPLHLR